MSVLVPVVVALPAHSALAGPLSYRSELALPPGTLVRVPLGRRDVLGVVWDAPTQASPPDDPPSPPTAQVRPVREALTGLPPLGPAWRALVGFAASYYQRAIGEVALAALPPQLRELDAAQLARRVARLARAEAATAPSPGRRPRKAQARAGGLPPQDAPPREPAPATDAPLAPSAEQAQALAAAFEGEGPFLLHGVTGSGKTEVYLQAAARVLAQAPGAQALVMVPEINLTPQLQARFEQRFGADRVVTMHSGMTPPQRLAAWLAAHTGAARIVLGTRLAVFASLPRCRLIVVDEEHDPSYKQQEGARHSARDLAVWRGRAEGARVLLGSATPSLESWHASRPAADGGRYQRLALSRRVGDAPLPRVRLVDMNLQPRGTVLARALVDAIAARAAVGEQVLVLLNRRGYAPVLHCTACDWKSDCPHCSAFRVFHKGDRSLRCHHCGLVEPVPHACPQCGNPDISPVGRGTERLEEHLAAQLAGIRRADGQPLVIARLDADSTRGAGALERSLAQVHDGAVDVLVGTQMIAKGHDFRRVTLVAALGVDAALFSHDFRAPERLAALLMQAGGRAGRAAARPTDSADPSGMASPVDVPANATPSPAELWVQTLHPRHPLFDALRRHDWAGFAERELASRRAAGLPPFAHQALLRADARTQAAAQAFLAEAAALAGQDEALAALAAGVTRYPPVPLTVQRVADVERAQMLLESASRPALQRFLAAWQPALRALRGRHRGVLRWAIDVDPQQI